MSDAMMQCCGERMRSHHGELLDWSKYAAERVVTLRQETIMRAKY